MLIINYIYAFVTSKKRNGKLMDELLKMIEMYAYNNYHGQIVMLVSIHYHVTWKSIKRPLTAYFTTRISIRRKFEKIILN